MRCIAILGHAAEHAENDSGFLLSLIFILPLHDSMFCILQEHHVEADAFQHNTTLQALRLIASDQPMLKEKVKDHALIIIATLLEPGEISAKSAHLIVRDVRR